MSNSIFAVRWLWVGSYYDGPLEGLGLWRGRKVWLTVVDPFADRRQYRAHALSPDEIAAIEARHQDFRQWVGTHTDYGTDAKGRWRVGGIVLPSSHHKQFYDKYPPATLPNFSDHPVIGIWDGTNRGPRK